MFMDIIYRGLINKIMKQSDSTINYQMLRQSPNNKTILALRRDRDTSNDFHLAIIDGKYSYAENIQGRIIQQSLAKSQSSEIVFEARDLITIRKDAVLEAVEVQCREEPGHFIISKDEYERISHQMANQHDSDDDKDYDVSDDYAEEDQGAQQLQQLAVRKRGRPKGSKNRKKNTNQSYSDSDEEDIYQQKKRGRGRPKGSKNKKNLKKFERQINFRTLMGGHLAKGNARNARAESSMDNQSEKSERRGKGRPKGSKNKNKLVAKMIEKSQRHQKSAENMSSNAHPQTQPQQKRSRGRPKGVKNKPRQEPEDSLLSEFDENYNLNDLTMFTDKNCEVCCERCAEDSLKEDFLSSSCLLTIHGDKIFNFTKNIRLERTDNVVLWALRSNNIETVKWCLKQVHKTKRHFRCVWDPENKLQKNIFTVKTKKQALSRSGKEGMTVLLHDADHTPKNNISWWNLIGIDRILQNLSNETDKAIIELFKNQSSELKNLLYENIPTLLRCGNYEITRYLLKDIVPSCYSTYGFSKQHLQCLDSVPKIQFKKINILKQNFCGNFCSPIHCASINPNPELLDYLLSNIPDYNVGDSLNRKPVHYASAAVDSRNLQTLVKHGSDLKDMDKTKMTPLMVAAYYGRSQCLEYILSIASEISYVNFRSEHGFSALHYAVLGGHLDCVKILLANNTTEINLQTKDKQTAMHLVCGTGRLDIFHELVAYDSILDQSDKYRRTPIMFAIRNHNNTILSELLNMQCKYYKNDSSLNSSLHYAAAYGNLAAIKCLLQATKQSRNKRHYYPWEVAVGKGHIGCARLLQAEETVDEGEFTFSNNMALLVMKIVDGTNPTMQMVRYLLDCNKYDINAVDQSGSNGLHYICSISEERYLSNRGSEDQFIGYNEMESTMIKTLLQRNVNAQLINRKGQSPLNLCVENSNIIGMQLLLNEKADLDFQSSKGYTILHYLSQLASSGSQGMQFVLSKLPTMDRNNLKDSFKKVDANGFESILYFVRDFTLKAKQNFHKDVIALQEPFNGSITAAQNIEIHKAAFSNFLKQQDQFQKLVCFLMDQGCDANVQVMDKRKEDESQSFKKWGIQHFLMRLPSLKILSLFRRRIRDFNSQNSSGMTALHLFCTWVKKGNLLESEVELPQMRQYTGQKSLQFLLENGLNPNILDVNRSTPLLYAAINGQIQFMVLLRRFGSIINTCNHRNQVPFIEIINMKDRFTIEEIESLLKIGADPNYQDLQKRNSLHHTVYNSANLDCSSDLCRLLFEYGIRVNSLDKYNRTPLFYCFTNIDPDQKQPNLQDKIQIMQTLISHKDININHTDAFHRTALHYACQKNYYLSIQYLLDKSPTIDTQITDFQGNTSLAICLRHRNFSQASLLLKRGAKDGYVIDGQAKMSYFAYAFSKFSAGVCYMLLDNGYPVEKALKEVTNQTFRNLLVKKYKTVE